MDDERSRIMKKYVVVIACMLFALTVHAQEQRKFSPEKFDADMEEFITREAGLDAQEAAKFFPIFREMHKKQRALYGRMRQRGQQKPAGEAACAEAIREADKLNIELRQVEQKYHEKMFKVISAAKVYDALRAESHFHRQMMRGWQQPPIGRQKDRRR